MEHTPVCVNELTFQFATRTEEHAQVIAAGITHIVEQAIKKAITLDMVVEVPEETREEFYGKPVHPDATDYWNNDMPDEFH